MQVTDQTSPDAPSLTQAIILQMVYLQYVHCRCGRCSRLALRLQITTNVGDESDHVVRRNSSGSRCCSCMCKLIGGSCLLFFVCVWYKRSQTPFLQTQSCSLRHSRWLYIQQQSSSSSEFLSRNVVFNKTIAGRRRTLLLQSCSFQNSK